MANREDLFDDEPAPSKADRTARAAGSGDGGEDGPSGGAPDGKVSRRRFFFGAGVAAAGAAAGAGVTAGVMAGRDSGSGSGGSATTTKSGTGGAQGGGITLGAPDERAVGQAVVKLTINGKDEWISVAANESLAEVLRGRLGLVGTKVGCDRSECSACTVLIDGAPQNSCSLLAIREDGRKITTIEGLEQNGTLSAVQQAFLDNMGLQCGFCTPGQILQATALLAQNAKPTEDDIRRYMSGNLCKCAAYPNILAAVQQAAKGVVS